MNAMLFCRMMRTVFLPVAEQVGFVQAVERRLHLAAIKQQ
jgi:hypothetical protein